MAQIFKYMKQCSVQAMIIFLLLIVQAYCDLELPQYTSKIVDVGIGQGGIEYAAPIKVSGETYGKIQLMLSDTEKEIFSKYYEADQEGNFVLTDKSAKAQKEIDAIICEKLTMSMPKEAQSYTLAAAAQFIKAEYEKVGVDTAKIQTDYLWKIGFKMLGLSGLMLLVAVLVGYFASRTGAVIGRNLREKVFGKVVSFSGAEMDRFSTASLITRCTNDIQQIQMVTTMFLRMVLYAPIIGVGGIVRVMNTKTGMGWLIAAAVGAIMSLVMVLMVVAMPKFKMMQTLVDKLNLVSREILTGIPVIRAFSREKYEEKRFDKASRDLMKTQLFTGRVMNFMMPVMMLIMNAVSVAIVWFGGKNIAAGNMQVGEMLAFITYTMQIVMSFLMLTMISIILPRAGVAANRVEEVLRTRVSVVDADKVKDDSLKSVKGEITFHNVSFRYPGADEDALHHLNFTAKSGETTAIIGSTGCGKSTLLHLIPRFYDVTEGEILLDGVDIREISQKKLRSVIGFVSQKAVLFSGTIDSNLKYAGSFVDDQMRDEAASIAQAVEFIENKPEKFHSHIAQGGSNVSGGQKQRLSIARAIAKNPKVFLFDDSFSALDFKTDAALRKALHEKVKDATILIVAQRISTILHADQIIVLDNGTIAGKGTHEELLENCEAYKEIAKSQLSEKELKGGMLS